MSFSDILNQLTNKKKNQDERERNPAHEKQDAPPNPPENAEPAPPPNIIPEKKAPPNIDEAIDLFESIQEIIDDDEENVKIPAEALLKKLPEQLQGPLFNGNKFPEDCHMNIEAQPLLEKLQSGKVVYHLKDIPNNLPVGWIRDDSTAEVELDLATVYSAIPSELIEVSSKISQLMEEIINMPDYFKPKASNQSPAEPAKDEGTTAKEEHPPEKQHSDQPLTPPAEAAQPDTATTPPPPAEKPRIAPEDRPKNLSEEKPEKIAVEQPRDTAKERQPDYPQLPQAGMNTGKRKAVLRPARHEPKFPAPWDGRECLSTAVSPTDVNEASLNELLMIPGVGRKRAEAIIHYRSLHGDIESIYDLLCIPGIGEKNFIDMTGLDPSDRQNRSRVINEILGLSGTSLPRLPQITDAAVKKFNVEACILVGKDGIIIAQSHSMSPDSARQYAALAPKIFRGTKKYIPRLSGKHPNMFALPGSNPPLLFAGLEHLFLILALNDNEGFKTITDKAAELAGELDWVFSNRAVVGKK